VSALHTPITVTDGTWHGNYIRRARKVSKCDYWLGEAGRCKAVIAVGDLYLEGEMNEDAGGYGSDRYCMTCAGDEARAAIAKAVA